MSGTSINNDVIIGGHSLIEQHLNSITNPTKSSRVIQQAKKGPMNPTPL
jgi:hypothetical protein